MSQIEPQAKPQIYLITPAEFEIATYPDQLAAILDSTEIACVRLALATQDEDRIGRAADALREVTHTRDVAIVIEKHLLLVERFGLDGVHLLDGSRNVRKARKELGDDAIVGAFSGASRHDGLSAAEGNADYVAFGPAGLTGLGDGTVAETDLFQWWSEMIEVPIVAEGALDVETIARLSGMTDFFGIGDEIWTKDDPQAALARLVAAIG